MITWKYCLMLRTRRRLTRTMTTRELILALTAADLEDTDVSVEWILGEVHLAGDLNGHPATSKSRHWGNPRSPTLSRTSPICSWWSSSRPSCRGCGVSWTPPVRKSPSSASTTLPASEGRSDPVPQEGARRHLGFLGRFVLGSCRVVRPAPVLGV